MGLWDRLLGGSPADRVAPSEPLPGDVVASPFPQLRIKHGATLEVPEGQVAVLVYQGKAADTFPAGRHLLDAAHLPRLAAAKGVVPADTSFRARVYFVSVQRFSEQPWATQAALVSRDPEFGTVRAKANGTFGFVVTQPGAFLTHLRPADDQPTEVNVQILHNLVVSLFSEAVRTGEVAGSDLLGPPGRLGLVVGEQLARELDNAGVTLTRFKVAKVSVPPDVQRPPATGASHGGADGYTAMFSERVHRSARPAAPANPARAAAAAKVALELSSMLDDGDAGTPQTAPQSHRFPLADAPDGVFAPRPTGPVSERLMLPESGGSESGYVPGPTTWRMPRPDPEGPPPITQPGQPEGPPPLPAAVEFHVALGGAPAGPFDVLTLAAKVREGSFAPNMLVWRRGMDRWVAAETVAELSPLFKHEPPPLPPE